MGNPVAPPEKQANIRPSPINGLPPPAQHQWKPGQSGNPAGRPKNISAWERLLALLEKREINGKPLGNRQVADLIAEAILKGILKGNSRLIINFLDRTEGKVPDRVAGANGDAIEHVHRVEFVEVVVPEAEHGDGHSARALESEARS
jgi:hypothetical protein